MIRKTFKTREELEAMPLNFLRNVDIQTPEEEAIVQEIVNIKLAKEPKLTNFKSSIKVPIQIKSPEEERFWQAKLDAEKKEFLGKQLGQEYQLTELNNKIKDLEEQKAQLQTEKTDTLDQSKLITLPKTEIKKRFCEFCDSKGHVHKLNCTRKK